MKLAKKILIMAAIVLAGQTAEARITVYGGGGAVSSGGTVRMCPERVNAVCAVIGSSITTTIEVGEEVTVEPVADPSFNTTVLEVGTEEAPGEYYGDQLLFSEPE